MVATTPSKASKKNKKTKESPLIVLSSKCDEDENSVPPAPMVSKRAALHIVVIAHPDDESMFFLPTILSLREAGQTVWILCLTTGNYDGLGRTRLDELSKVCDLLKVPKLIHLNVPELKDHPTQAWSLDRVTFRIQQALQVALIQESVPCEYGRLVLITFDVHGVSGHINHRDTHLGVKNFVLSSQLATTTKTAFSRLPPMEAWQLETVHFLHHKYLPVWEWVLRLLYLCYLWRPLIPSLLDSANNNDDCDKKKQQQPQEDVVVVFRSVHFWLHWQAMATHASQYVWYRRLFVVFSCYTSVNRLRKIRQ